MCIRDRFAFVFPLLYLNYLGQGALILNDPQAIESPFFRMVPSEILLIPLVVLATFATVIASQAVISGAFSLTSQAMQLGYCPRIQVRFTSEREKGQLYVPNINWLHLLLSLIHISPAPARQRQLLVEHPRHCQRSTVDARRQPPTTSLSGMRHLRRSVCRCPQARCRRQ